jgi:hypothetical protein
VRKDLKNIAARKYASYRQVLLQPTLVSLQSAALSFLARHFPSSDSHTQEDELDAKQRYEGKD